jgi:hypothetical protein
MKICGSFTDVFSQDTTEDLKFTWHLFSFHNSVLAIEVNIEVI